MNYLFSALLVLSLVACKHTNNETKPKLIVLISVDQMKWEYMKKQPMPFLTQELSLKGIDYSNTKHYHAKTSTAAGHATIATGCLPSTHGIVNNNVYIRATGVKEYSILDTTVNYVGIDSCSLLKVSAARLQKPSFGDIVKSHDSLSKSYSVSLKDRSAILMGGHHANRAFWFDSYSTQMVSTDYYEEKFPEWAMSYRAEEVLSSDISKGWHFLGHGDNLAPDSSEYECGTFNPWFPHTIESIDKNRRGSNVNGTFMWNTPFGDNFVLRFAQQLIKEEQLGQDSHCDVLTIGLSAADVIGHHFGPQSHEVADYYYRLDGYLHDFVDSLNSSVGKDNYILVLTADHGVVGMPENNKLSESAVRIDHAKFDTDMERIDLELKKQYDLPLTTFLKSSYAGIEPDFEYLNTHNIDSTIYLTALKLKLKSLPYIVDAYTPNDYLNSTPSSSLPQGYKTYFRNSYDPRFGYYVQLLPSSGSLVDMRSCGTTHGTPYSYDTHVPFIMYGGMLEPKKIEHSVWTIDIAPTILGILGYDMHELMDGTDLLQNESNDSVH